MVEMHQGFSNSIDVFVQLSTDRTAVHVKSEPKVRRKVGRVLNKSSR